SRGRRRDVIFKTPRTHVVREGHRLVYVDPPSLDGVPFASPVAKALAKEAQLGPDAFEEWTPSSKSGFSKKDVEQILEALANPTPDPDEDDPDEDDPDEDDPDEEYGEGG